MRAGAYSLAAALVACTVAGHAQGFYTKTDNSKIAVNAVDTNNPLSFDSVDRFQIVAIFKRIGNHDSYARVIEHASGGGGANGYYIGANVGSTDHRFSLQFSNSSLMSYSTSRYSTGDIMFFTGGFDVSGNEYLNYAANRAKPSDPKLQNMKDANATGTADLTLGGSSWSTSRDPNIELYKVLMYEDWLSQKQMDVISLSHGRQYPVKNLVGAWATTSFALNPGETMTTSKPAKAIVGGQDADEIDNTPQTVSAVVGHAWQYGGMY